MLDILQIAKLLITMTVRDSHHKFVNTFLDHLPFYFICSRKDQNKIKDEAVVEYHEIEEITYERDFVMSKQNKTEAPKDFYDIKTIKRIPLNLNQPYIPFFPKSYSFYRKVYLYKQRVKPLNKGEIDGLNPRRRFQQAMPITKASSKALSEVSLGSLPTDISSNYDTQSQYTTYSNFEYDDQELSDMVKHLIKQSRRQDPNWHSKDFVTYVYKCDNYSGKGGNMNKCLEEMLRAVRKATDIKQVVKYFMRMKKENCKVSPNNYKLFLQTALIFQLIQIAKFLLDEMDKLQLVIRRDILEEFMVLKLKYTVQLERKKMVENANKKSLKYRSQLKQDNKMAKKYQNQQSVFAY